MVTSVLWSTITPRALEHWGRKIGFGNRLEVQALQWGKYPIKAVNYLTLGLNPRFEREVLRIEERIDRLQYDNSRYEAGFRQALARTARKFNASFWSIAVANGAVFLAHYEQLDWHNTAALGIPLLLTLVAGHYIKNSYLKAKSVIHELSLCRDSMQVSRERYRQLFYQAPIGFHNIAPDGTIVAVNDKWLVIMGYAKKNVVGRKIFDFIVPEQRENAKARFKARKKGKAVPPINGDRQYQRKDGSRLVVATHNTDVRNADGSLKYVQTSFLDLTELRAIQAEQNKAEIRQKEMEAATLAIQGLMHGLSQKVQAMSGYFDLTQMNPQKSEYATGLKTSIDQVNAYFQVFDIFRFGIGRKQNIDISKLAARLFNSTKERYGNVSPLAELSVDARLGEVSFPLVALQVILEKVLDNAFQAIAPGGRVALAIQKASQAETPGFEMIVTDNGGGITPENKEKMFRPFFSTDPDGMANERGLSLALVQYAAHKLGGTIEVNSEVGQGTEFKIWLPL